MKSNETKFYVKKAQRHDKDAFTELQSGIQDERNYGNLVITIKYHQDMDFKRKKTSGKVLSRLLGGYCLYEKNTYQDNRN